MIATPRRKAGGRAPSFDPAVALEQEAMRRELARRQACYFADYIDPASEGAYLAPHLRLIGGYLDRAMAGTLWDGMAGHGKKILIITTPPRHWKSSLISQKAVAYFVGKRAAAGEPHSVILTSYGATLAEKSSRSALETVRDNPRFKTLFPTVAISRQSQSMTEWALEGSAYPACIAAGVGGGLTGQGADMLVIDDPIKDSVQANSASYRESLWEWWAEVARTRLNPSGFAVIVMTRWHIDDLVGRLMEQVRKGEGERVVHLRLPAIAETAEEREAAARAGLPLDEDDPLGRGEGVALWPERYGADEMRDLQRKFPFVFAALYQGTPMPKGGYILSREDFTLIPSAPKENITWIWGSDWAITEKEMAKGKDPDYTAMVLVGLHLVNGKRDDARLVIGFVARGQHDPHQARQMVKRQLHAFRAPLAAGGDNVDKIHLGDLRADADLVGHTIMPVLTRKDLGGDKVAKAMPWIEMAKAGRVDVVVGPWNEEFFNEVERFPNGLHDDQIDAISVGVAAHGQRPQGVDILPVGIHDLTSYDLKAVRHV